jgi:hypothetical protein
MPICNSCKKFAFVDTAECINCGDPKAFGPTRSHLIAWILGSTGFAVVIWILWAIFT